MGKGGSVDRVLVPKDEGTRPLNNVKQEQTHLAKLAASNPDKRFCKLYRLICHPEWLMKALDAIRVNKGFNTPGTDGVRGEDLDWKQMEQLAAKLRTGTYHPTPVRRVYIVRFVPLKRLTRTGNRGQVNHWPEQLHVQVGAEA